MFSRGPSSGRRGRPAAWSLEQPVKVTLQWILAYQMVIDRLGQPVDDTQQGVFASRIVISSLSVLFSFHPRAGLSAEHSINIARPRLALFSSHQLSPINANDNGHDHGSPLPPEVSTNKLQKFFISLGLLVRVRIVRIVRLPHVPLIF
jgi:hypothetical protein